MLTRLLDRLFPVADALCTRHGDRVVPQWVRRRRELRTIYAELQAAMERLVPTIQGNAITTARIVNLSNAAKTYQAMGRAGLTRHDVRHGVAGQLPQDEDEEET